MSTKPRLIEMNVLKKVIKNNKLDDEGVVDNLCRYTGGGLVYLVKNYNDFILVILFLFIVLYFRYKLNKKIKKSSNLASKEVEINYIRNQDIINNEVINISDDIKSDHNLDDDILNHIKKEINNIDKESLKPINFGYEYSSY